SFFPPFSSKQRKIDLKCLRGRQDSFFFSSSLSVPLLLFLFSRFSLLNGLVSERESVGSSLEKSYRLREDSSSSHLSLLSGSFVSLSL
ncbi:hypothetical protein CSUI_005809, partial [Cystoisospora suis]